MKKSFKIGVVAVLLIAAGAVVFAFAKPSQPQTQTIIKQNAVFADVYYQYTGTPICFPLNTPDARAAAIALIQNPNNWSGPLTSNPIPPCTGGTCLCSIRVQDSGEEETSFEEAIGILSNQIETTGTLTHGGDYTSGTNEVEVFLRTS